ncbi:saccharopine dehydrogenase NADP-binding domain-containing protein [Mycobacterium intermedium]|uniref:saccharopine dehydrogenase NADP-binding domain-containing protein n=1 Tax=Mycobacterium intermedium TaxID=28445 RepID=UPI000ABCAA7F|nr:saccharopine dehydrogenase NADP-binding domain-containing protein [Mycobacterium intermedium]MCV6967637.1 saccharopine dehydrogenase NADP-binding domain-containing protein [Mycobacterium intermedium]
MTGVLLLGGTGAVGRGCFDVLTRLRGMSVVLAGRDEARLREVAPGADVARIDITDAAAVTAVATQCDVVVNCAGPSTTFSAQVAEAAVAAGVPYVDPGGDQALMDRLTATGAGVPVVLQAGVQPGLSGLLLRLLALRATGAIEDVTAWCGGLQELTPASVLEYLASLHDTQSHPGAVLRDGVIRRATPDECEPAPASCFPDSVTARPHLDAETVAVAAHLGIGNVCWMNVFDGAHSTRAMQRMAIDDERSPDLEAVRSAAKLDLFGRQPYFAIVARAHDGVGSTTAAFSCPDSYRVTGAVAAFAATRAADLPAEVHPFWSIDEPPRALEFVTEAIPQATLSCCRDSALPIEEGAL